MVLLALAQAGCSSSDGVARTRSGLISGTDDRLEAYALEPALKHSLTDSVAALAYAHHFVFSDSERVPVLAPRLGDALDLCPEEAFRDQPAAAQCSGVLLDDDLLATAGHCLGADPEQAARICSQLRVVFGFELSQPDWDESVSSQDVFTCKRVVLHERVVGDYAVIQLDRSAATATRSPAPLGTRPTVGDSVSVVSTGAGLPLKVELAASVLESSAASSFFTVASDTFAGGSGGGVFTRDFGLVGLLAQGGSDWESVGNCTRAARVMQSSEQHQHIDAVRSALCARPWPTERLCGTPDVCGDRVCGSTESHDACPRDCALPQCGDQLCELDERESCPVDCHRFDRVPPSWSFEPEGYFTAHPEAGERTGSQSNSGCAIGVAREGAPEGSLSLALLGAGCLARRLRGRLTRLGRGGAVTASPCRAPTSRAPRFQPPRCWCR